MKNLSLLYLELYEYMAGRAYSYKYSICEHIRWWMVNEYDMTTGFDDPDRLVADFKTRLPGIFSRFFWHHSFIQSNYFFGRQEYSELYYWWNNDHDGYHQRLKFLLHLAELHKKLEAKHDFNIVG